MTREEMTRREALAWLARAAAVGWVLPGACAWAEDLGTPKPAPKLANLSALRNDSARLLDEQGIILVRTSKGVAAFPNVCSHKRQELSVDEKSGAIFCPLHGSQFNLEGQPTNGPANRALKRYQVSIKEQGDILVDKNKTAAEGAWAELPAWAKPKQK